MKTKLIGLVSATALIWALAAAPALAVVTAGGGTTNWDFFTLGGSPASPGASLSTPAYTFTQGPLSLTTYAMTYSTSKGWIGSPASLYIKNGGTAAEQGLGLNDDPYGYNEIAYPNGIELTGFSSENMHISSVTIGSLQAGESFQILGWNNGWTPLASGMGLPVSQTYSGSNLLGYSDLIVWDPSATASSSSGSNDIVLQSVTTVPEPGTLALLSFGLAAVGFAVSRRRKSKTEA